MGKKKRRKKFRKILSSIGMLVLIALVVVGAFHIGKNVLHIGCRHEHGEDGLCTICGRPYPHEYEEGYCTLCGAVDPDYVFPDVIDSFSFICAGDLMAHTDNLRAAYTGDGSYYNDPYNGTGIITTDGSFDFTTFFKYIKSQVSSANLSIVNLETTLSTGGPEYNGSPTAFNCPDDIADAIKDTGFDVVYTCNNHSLDYGKITGLRRTVRQLRERNLTVVGTRNDTTENRSSVIEVTGDLGNTIKVGLVAYTYETTWPGYERTLNGAYMPDGAWNYLNSYRFGNDGLVLDEDKAAIASEISWCREQGAQIVICYFHWDSTNEYVLKTTDLQKDLAKFAAEEGADIIFGSHSHRVGEIEILSVEQEDGTTKNVPVYYSLGNFISNQRYETMDGDPYDQPYATEQEIMAKVCLSYNITKGTYEFTEISAIPLYVDKYTVSGKINYRIIPLNTDYASLEDLSVSGNKSRADYALECITDVIGEKFLSK